MAAPGEDADASTERVPRYKVIWAQDYSKLPQPQAEPGLRPACSQPAPRKTADTTTMATSIDAGPS